MFTGKIRQISVSKSYEMVYQTFEKFATKRFKRVMQDRLNQYIIMTLGIFMIIIDMVIFELDFLKYISYMFLNWGIRNYISNRNCHNWYFFNFYTSTTDNGHFNGVIGFVVTLFFIAMKAPDLALTQLVVETITTILFIVSFSRLPNVPRSNANKKEK